MLDLVVTSKVWTGTTCLTTTAPSWLIFKIFPICHLARLLRTQLMRKHYPPLALLLAFSKQFWPSPEIKGVAFETRDAKEDSHHKHSQAALRLFSLFAQVR